MAQASCHFWRIISHVDNDLKTAPLCELRHFIMHHFLLNHLLKTYYSMNWYPFDLQTCSMILAMKGKGEDFADLHPDNLQHLAVSWQI